MNVSFIISTYNRHDALICVLNALNKQHDRSFEVVIADDGSAKNTSDAIEKFQKESNLSVTHVWQEDLGFHAAQIRNKAVAKSTGDYLIFLDGDCLVFPDFIDKHLSLAEPGYFVRGSRVMLTELGTRELIEKKVNLSELSLLKLINLRVTKRINRFFPLIKLPLNSLRKRKETDWYGVKTCNLGMWRSDFMSINGFDESYVGWGHEDADLAVRLIRSGVRRKEGVNAVTVMHLWHPLNDRSQLSDNEERLQLVQQSENIRVEQGVSKYL